MIPMVEVRNLTLRYGQAIAVDSVSFAAEKGALTVLVGPSGCGKTSLLRAIAGFEIPDRGEILIDGKTVVGSGTWTAPEKRHVGMVFQQGALFPHLTVIENIEYGLAGARDARERAESALERVGMGELGDRYPDELSGGQQQRVAVARAMAPSPSVVLLDEPFANLDAALRDRVRDEVRKILRDAKMTAILVTHDRDEALSVADRIAVMRQGRLLQSGPPLEVYARPSTASVASIIGEGQFVEGVVERGVFRSSLGTAVTNAPDGPAQILIRPEELTTAGDGDGVVATFLQRRFFGHDVLDEVRLADGIQLLIRRSSLDNIEGEPIRVRLRRKSYLLFSMGGMESWEAVAD